MYKKVNYSTSGIKRTEKVSGETIEEKIERIISNKEPIRDGAPLIYTERKDGVNASYNPRTDRFEVAIEATSKIEKSYKAKRENNAKMTVEKGGLDDGKAEPIQGKSGTDTDK